MIHFAHHVAEAMQQFGLMGFCFRQDFARHEREYPHKMLRTLSACNRCDSLASSGYAHLRQQKRRVMPGEVLKCFILQVKCLSLLHRRCDLQHELLPCFGLQVEVAISLTWQRAYLCMQTIQFKSDASGVFYSEKRFIIVQHEVSLRINDYPFFTYL